MRYGGDQPIHGRIGSVLVAEAYEGHHDDAWRKDFYAWQWDLPDIGPALYVRLVESDYPHETNEVTDMIVPVDFLRSALEAVSP